MGVAHNLLKNVEDAIEFLLETRRLYAKLGCEQVGEPARFRSTHPNLNLLKDGGGALPPL